MGLRGRLHYTIALARHAAGDYQLALDCLKQSLAITLPELGEEHDDVVGTQADIAAIEQCLSDDG